MRRKVKALIVADGWAEVRNFVKGFCDGRTNFQTRVSVTKKEIEKDMKEK